MPHHHFISYSGVDGLDLALHLCDELQIGPPSIEAWLDKRRLQADADWDRQVVEAIRDCESLIFMLTRDSVEDASVCKNEWVQALKYKKPIVLVRCHAEAEPPFRLNSRQYVDFTHDFNTGLAKLRKDLLDLSSPRGLLRAMQYRLNDAQRDLRRAADPIETARIVDEIDQLKKQIAEQQRLVENPQAAAQQTERSIQAGLERERQPEKPIGGAAHSKFINPPPDIAPTYFQDRAVETELIGQFLKDAACRVLTINGRAGIGKTAMACRLLKALENGHLPDDLGPLSVDGIVYLSAKGSHRINTPNLYADLSKLLPADKAQTLEALYKDPQTSTAAKMHALLAEFPSGRTVVLLDNFEDLIDPETLGIADAELDEALRALLSAPQHAVKVIVTTRISPHDLLLIRADRQMQIHLDEGLESPHAENILRAMDADGKVGLKTAPDAVLNEARIFTRGYPRALVALYGILSADRYTALEEVLSNPPPKDVVEALVGEAFNRLDPTAQKVMEALAVYERPVTPAAIDYLLQAYLPGINSAPVLNRLVNMQFVRKEGSRYYQHAVDRAYALSRIPKGDVWDRYAFDSDEEFDDADERVEEIEETDKSELPYTQYALLHRGAEYFKQARQPRETWKKLDDLAPQLNEFELRYAGEDYDTAADVLIDIDFDYLLLWGHYRLMIELHERLQGKIDDQSLQRNSVGSLGMAHFGTGQIQQAIRCYEQALGIARDMKDKQGEGVWLGNLSMCYAALGQTARAIESYEQALAIAREIGDRRNEGAWLCNLGNRYAVLGQTAHAIEFYEQALGIAREVGDRSSEGAELTCLGNCYAALGQTARAIEFHEQALGILHEIGDRSDEGYDLGNLADTLVDVGRYSDAVKCAQESVKIGEEIGDPVIGCDCGRALALAHFCAGDLPAARAAAEAARQWDAPQYNHGARVLLGVIALRQKDLPAAKAAFTEVVTSADELLTQSAQNLAALDSKGLALCGLAVCGDGARVNDAIVAYRAAREINKDAGVVKRVLRLFDAVAVEDVDGILRDVRKAAAGEE